MRVIGLKDGLSNHNSGPCRYPRSSYSEFENVVAEEFQSIIVLYSIANGII